MVKAEGDCMFLSLAVAKDGDARNAVLDRCRLQIRNEIADFLRRNKTHYAPYCTYGDFEEWTKPLRHPLLKWGGHMCLHAAFILYKRTSMC